MSRLVGDAGRRSVAARVVCLATPAASRRPFRVRLRLAATGRLDRGRRRSAEALVAACLITAGCSVSPDVSTAFLGPTPGVVVVLPVADDSGVADLPSALLATIERPLRERGYYVVPIEVGLTLVGDAGYPGGSLVPAGEVATVGRAIGADASLQISVATWRAVWGGTLQRLDYDIGYRLASSVNGATLWEHRAAGSWSWEGGRTFTDHDAAYDQFYGVPLQPRDPVSPFTDLIDVTAALQRSVVGHMGVGPLLQ